MVSVFMGKNRKIMIFTTGIPGADPMTIISGPSTGAGKFADRQEQKKHMETVKLFARNATWRFSKSWG